MALIGAFMVAILAAQANYAATPQGAALRAVYGDLVEVDVERRRDHVSVQRVNIAGRYAAVLLRGAMMEGSAIAEPILVARFSFG